MSLFISSKASLLSSGGLVALLLLPVVLMAYPRPAQCSEAASPEPEGGVKAAGGSVFIPFTVNVGKDDIKAVIAAVVPANAIGADVESLKALITEKVNKAAQAAHKTVPEYLGGKTIDDLTNYAKTQIDNAAADIQRQMTSSIDTAAASMKIALDKARPVVVVSGMYTYASGKEGGWGSLVATASGATQTGAKAVVGANLSVDLKPAGVDIQVPVSVEAGLTATARFTAAHPVATYPRAASTKTNAVPIQDVQVTIAAPTRAGLGWGLWAGGGATISTGLDRVQGILAVGEMAAGAKGGVYFPLQRGQYIFIGYETGVKDKSKDDLGIEPISRNHILDKAVPEKWDMQIAVEPAPDEKGVKVWKTVMVWRASDADGSMYQRVALTWMLKVPAGKKVELLPIEKVDASKEKGIDGLQFYKIPYAKVEDEVHYVLVAIGDKKDLFPKVIAIPKKYPIFSWSNWNELK